MKFETRKLADDEIEQGFDVLVATGEWLKRLGRRQRITNTSFQTYQKWQQANGNYALFDGKTIAGIFSLVTDPFVEWPDQDQSQSVRWLRALATDPEYRGQGVGALAIASSLELAVENQPLYLDCVAGFLPGYYQRMGFKNVSSRTLSTPSEESFDIVLMRHENRFYD